MAADEIDGWTIKDDGDGRLVATKDGVRPILVAGGPDTPDDAMRERLAEAIAETEGRAAPGGGFPAAAAGLAGHEATLVVADQEE